MLLNRPKRYSDESVSSYLFRLAKVNHGPIGVFLTKFKITRAEWLSNTFSNEQLERVALQINSSKYNLYQGTYNIYQEKIIDLSLYLLQNRMKYCPDCFREKAYHRVNWGLKPITICLRHSSRLLDVCPQCHAPIYMGQFMNGICNDCHFRYVFSKSTKVPLESIEHKFQGELQQTLVHDGEVLQSIGGLNIQQFLNLARHSFYLLEGQKSFIEDSRQLLKIFQNKRGGLQLNESLAAAYNHVYWMYQEFPLHFNKVLNGVLNNRRKRMYEQLKNFEVIFKNSRYERVQVAYNQFWLNELEKGTVRSDLSVFKYDQDLLNEKRHLRLEEAKRQGISKPRIQNLTQSGIIELRAEWNGKMPQYFIAKDQMIEYQKIQEKYITKMKVAEILGVKKESVTQLIQEGWLTEAKLPYDHNYRFSKDEVEILLKTITGEYKPNADGIAFHKALNKYSIIGLTVSKLIKFIHQGLLHPQVKVKGGNLSSTFFRKEEIGQCIEVMKLSRREEKGMTLTEVIQYLHIGERKMKRYMITGELLPYTVVTWNDGRQRYFFHEVDVLAFEEKIIGAISKKYPMDVSL